MAGRIRPKRSHYREIETRLGLGGLMQQAIENAALKRITFHISCVFYKMSHFLPNELFCSTAFIIIQIGGVWREKLVQNGHTIAKIDCCWAAAATAPATVTPWLPGGREAG